MNPITTRFAATLFACASTVAFAQQARPERHNGDHPAIVVQRLAAHAGYDYASKFYPHPAWLYLFPEEPSESPSALARGSTADQRSAIASVGTQQPVAVSTR